MEIKLLEDEFSVCKIRDLSGVNLTDAFYFIGKTDEELSLVCRTEHVPEETTDREDGWKAFRIEGVLDFSLIGNLAEISAVLAECSIGIFVVSTFGLFTNGLASFDKAYEEGLIYRVVTTNLIYQTPELLSREYYISCDMSKYIAYIIDTLNHDSSISDLLNPYDRIKNYVKKYNDAKNA